MSIKIFRFEVTSNSNGSQIIHFEGQLKELIRLLSLDSYSKEIYYSDAIVRLENIPKEQKGLYDDNEYIKVIKKLARQAHKIIILFKANIGYISLSNSNYGIKIKLTKVIANNLSRPSKKPSLVKDIERLGYIIDVKSNSNDMIRLNVINSQGKCIGWVHTSRMNRKEKESRNVNDINERINGVTEISISSLDTSLINALKDAKSIALANSYEILSKCVDGLDKKEKEYLEETLHAKSIDLEVFLNDFANHN